MRSTTLGIHGGLPNETVLLSSLHQLETVQIVRDCVFRESLHENAVHFGLMEVQSLGFWEILPCKAGTWSRS